MDPDDTVFYNARKRSCSPPRRSCSSSKTASSTSTPTPTNTCPRSPSPTPTPNDPVTTEHQLTYTSGFDNDIYGWAQWRDGTPALSGFVADEQPPRGRKPGQLSAYNSYYILIRLSIRDITGMPYGDYVEKNIFASLGMDSTSAESPWCSPRTSKERRPEALLHLRHVAVTLPPEIPSPAH